MPKRVMQCDRVCDYHPYGKNKKSNKQRCNVCDIEFGEMKDCEKCDEAICILCETKCEEQDFTKQYVSLNCFENENQCEV